MKSLFLVAATAAMVACNTMPTAGDRSTAGATSSFALKEFEIGAPMDRCPEGSLGKSESNGMTICLFGATTLANQPVTSHGVYLFEGRIAGANFTMKDRGQYANRAVFDALIAKYGYPLENKAHINEAQWRRNGQVLLYKGWQGDIGMMDQNASRRAAAAAASKNKSDL